ncbi:MAG: transposase domain-containing protein [Desulfosarcina sp.]|nr:transposase domain-containing protein [Desulfobacterales bacterium]
MVEVPCYKRRKRGRRPLPADLPFVVGRKNWLFSGNPEGARASAALFSLIETARANELEPYHYLRYLFDRLPVAETTEDYKFLLSQYLSPEQLKLNA